MSNVVKIKHNDMAYHIPRSVLNQYRADLRKVAGYNTNNIDVHMSFLYSGNICVVREFFRWYNSHSNFPPLKATEGY